MQSIPIFFLLTISLALLTSSTSAQLSEKDKQDIVRLHNDARSNVEPPASDMQRMEWDDELAQSARKHAETCPTEHSGMKGVGENLSWGWPTMTPTEAVREWIDEKSSYNYAGNECTASECFHYTQVVWAKSNKVGCAVNVCANIFGQKQVYAYVCHYKTPGNVVGEKPYQTGEACSKCATKGSCEAKLCPASNADDKKSPAPSTTSSPGTADPKSNTNTTAATTPIPTPTSTFASVNAFDKNITQKPARDGAAPSDCITATPPKVPVWMNVPLHTNSTANCTHKRSRNGTMHIVYVGLSLRQTRHDQDCSKPVRKGGYINPRINRAMGYGTHNSGIMLN